MKSAIDSFSSWLTVLAVLSLAACAAPSNKTVASGSRNTPAQTVTQPAAAPVPSASSDNDAVAQPSSEEAALETPAMAQARAKREQELHLNLVNKMIAQKNEFAALAHLDSYDRKWGSNFESKRLRADCLRRTGQLDEAETVYKSILGQQQSARIWYGLGKIAIARNDNKTAEMRLEKAVQVDPLMSDAYSDLGLLYLLDGKQDQSYNTLMKAQQLSANDPAIMANLALWGLVYQDFELARNIADRLKWSEKTRSQVLQQANNIRKKIQSGG